MIARTYGKLESGLSTNSDKRLLDPTQGLRARHMAARDEGQQAGMPVVSRHSAHIPPYALEMWIGDLKQPVGGVSREQEEIGILRMLSGRPLQPREVLSDLESHVLEQATADFTLPEEDHADGEEAATPEQTNPQPAPDPSFPDSSLVGPLERCSVSIAARAQSPPHREGPNHARPPRSALWDLQN